MRLTKKDIFNDDTIALFTDASYDTKNKRACSGFVQAGGDKYDLIIYNDITVYRAELLAIKLGLKYALEESDKKNIFIFSDSLLSIRSINEWIFNWCIDEAGMLFSTSTNKEVANQDIILDIINMVKDNPNRTIIFYHQRGHIKIKNYDKVRQTFSKFNNLDIEVPMLDVIRIYNDKVDNITRKALLNKHIKPEKHYSLYVNRPNYKMINKYKHISKSNKLNRKSS